VKPKPIASLRWFESFPKFACRRQRARLRPRTVVPRLRGYGREWFGAAVAAPVSDHLRSMRATRPSRQKGSSASLCGAIPHASLPPINNLAYANRGQCCNARIALWVLADIDAHPSDVRFTPENGHVQCNRGCPLCAKSRLMRCNNNAPIRSPPGRGQGMAAEW